MRIAPHQRYHIVDSAVPQGTPGNPPRLEVLEVLEYKGQFVMYSQILPFQQHIYRIGFEDMPGKRACFVVLPKESVTNMVDKITNLLKGRALAIQEIEPDANGFKARLNIVNWASHLGVLWGNDVPMGQKAGREELIQRGIKVVDIYLEWLRWDKAPKWVTVAKAGKPQEPEIPKLWTPG